MRCPYCGNDDTQVKDRRPTEDNTRDPPPPRLPDACGGRFTTFERVQLRELTVVKKSGRRVPFDRDKLVRSVDDRAAQAPVDPERVERMINGIVRQLEIERRERVAVRADRPTRSMEGLKNLDDVAYVRFASVYRNFTRHRGFQDRCSASCQREPAGEGEKG